MAMKLTDFETDYYGQQFLPDVFATPTVTPQAAPTNGTSSIDALTQQILGQNTTAKWTGEGYGGAEANARGMAKLLAGAGITDIRQFGKVNKYEPVQVISSTLNGRQLQNPSKGVYYEMIYEGETENGPSYRQRYLTPDEVSQVKNQYGFIRGYNDSESGSTEERIPVADKDLITKDGKLLGVTGQTYGNKATGQAIESGSGRWQRQGGEDLFGGTGEGKGNTAFRVQMSPDGTPVFYTTKGSSSDVADIMPLIQFGLMATGAGGLLGNAILGAGANQVAAGALGGALLGGGTAALSGQDVLKGALLGGAGGALSGYLNPATGDITAAPTEGSIPVSADDIANINGVDTSSSSLFGSGNDSIVSSITDAPMLDMPIIEAPPIDVSLPSFTEAPLVDTTPMSGTGITANNSGLGLNPASSGLNTIAVDGGLTNTGILSGSSLGTELLGTGTGVAGLTGTGILSGSELGTTLLGTTSTTPLVGTGVLSGSSLGAELLGTGANTAATVGGLTGLTNAANVGYGALDTGLSTGLTGLGSDALNTGINPSGATTGVPDTTAVTTPPDTNSLSNLTPSQIANILKGAMGLFGAVGASQIGSGGGGSPMGVGALPTQGIPLNSQDYFNAIQQNYNTLLPAMPKDVATPLANWYNSQYGA